MLACAQMLFEWMLGRSEHAVSLAMLETHARANSGTYLVIETINRKDSCVNSFMYCIRAWDACLLATF